MNGNQSQMVSPFVYCNTISKWPIRKVLFSEKCQTSSTFDLLGCECNRSKGWKLTVREKFGLQKSKLKDDMGEEEEGTYQTLQPHHLRKAKQKTNK